MQWVKNLLLVLPLLFAVDQVWEPGNIGTLLPYIPRLLVVFAVFCAPSSAVYLLNDVADREADRRHSTKWTRPIASGLVPVWLAVSTLAALAVVGMLGLYVIPPLTLPLIGAIYLIANVGYSLRLKRVALVDVMIVAGGCGLWPARWAWERRRCPGSTLSPRRARCSSKSAGGMSR